VILHFLFCEAEGHAIKFVCCEAGHLKVAHDLWVGGERLGNNVRSAAMCSRRESEEKSGDVSTVYISSMHPGVAKGHECELVDAFFGHLAHVACATMVCHEDT